MSSLRDLYEEVIVDHHQEPRNFGQLEGANRRAEGYNPVCGDQVIVYVKLKNGVVEDIRFEGTGCAISTASASMMTQRLKGKSLAEVDALFQGFQGLLTGKRHSSTEVGALGRLRVFSGVREFPMRVKCATLAWHTLRAAIEGHDEVVSTE